MKKSILLASLLTFTLQLNAQEIYAVTGVEKGKIEFQDFRSIHEKSGSSHEILLHKTENLQFKSHKSNITNRYIAAMTMVDGKIMYIPMTQANLLILDSKSKKGDKIQIENSKIDHKNVETLYTRMTTGADGYAYAINNIGSEFLKISSTGEIQNLGEVTSLMEQFKKMNNPKEFAGGDMIADKDGNLYVISAFGNIFTLNPNTLHATYLGKVTGTPENYTINGAAVTKDGKVLLGTSSEHGFYILDMDTLEAKFSHEAETPIYDLYSPYFIENKVQDQLVSNYNLYPTIVKNSELNIVSKSNDKEQLEVSVWNLNQKKVYSKTLSVKSVGDFKVKLNGNLQPGIYILKAVNQDGKEVINTKFTLVR